MKDLQELFESLSTEEVIKISEMGDKKSLNPYSIEKVLDYVAKVYCWEKSIKEASLTADEVSELANSFVFSASMYANVKIGHMKIVKGRLRLTDSNSCSFSLTSKGIKHVEKNLLK